MQRLFALLILLAMLIGGTAFAQTNWSNPDTWNTATIDMDVTGTTPEQVEFSVASVSLTLDSNALAPNQTFDVVVPVANQTNRAIEITDDANSTYGGGYIDVTSPNPTTVGVNGTANLRYTVSTGPNLSTSDTSDTQTITFTLTGTGINPPASDQWF